MALVDWTSITLIVIILVVGYLYLLVTNTAAALRIGGGVAKVLFYAIQGVMNFLFGLFRWVVSLFGKK